MLDNSCDSLQSILFGSFVPPPVQKTRVHKIGFESQFRYVPPKVAPKREIKKPRESDANILKLLAKSKRWMTSHQVAAKVDMTRNHCGIVLARLYNENKVDRVKQRVGKARLYVYKIKEQPCQ